MLQARNGGTCKPYTHLSTGCKSKLQPWLEDPSLEKLACSRLLSLCFSFSVLEHSVKQSRVRHKVLTLLFIGSKTRIMCVNRWALPIFLLQINEWDEISKS